jgi:hypothetical protein
MLTKSFVKNNNLGEHSNIFILLFLKKGWRMNLKILHATLLFCEAGCLIVVY